MTPCRIHIFFLPLYYYKLLMNRQAKIKSIPVSIQFFNSLQIDSINPKLLEHHLTFIQQFLEDPQINQSCPKEITGNIFGILVTKYYQIFKQNRKVIAESFLENKFISLMRLLYEKIREKDRIMKNIYFLCLQAHLNVLKLQMGEEVKSNETIQNVLKFNKILLGQMVKKSDIGVKQYYPRTISVLSLLLRKNNVGLKAFQLVLTTLQFLILQNSCFTNSKLEGRFDEECFKRLNEDIEYLINRFYALQQNFKYKVKEFSNFLLNFYKPQPQPLQNQIQLIDGFFNNDKPITSSMKVKLFTNIILLSQLNELKIPLETYNIHQKQLILQAYKENFITTAKRLMKIQVDLQLKKQQLSKIAYMIQFIDFTEDSEEFIVFSQLISVFFRISTNHNLISIPHHAFTIPVDKLNPSHTKENYPIKNVLKQYEKQFDRTITEIITFFELQTSVVDIIALFFLRLTHKSKKTLLAFLNDRLCEYEYKLDMSLTNLYQYLTLLLTIKYAIKSNSKEEIDFSSILTLFEAVINNQCVKSLKASYIQQQLLISVTLQIILKSYQFLRQYYQEHPTLSNKLRLSQSTISYCEKILNQLSQQSYLIRLIAIQSLLSISKSMNISEGIKPFQATIIHRNKNNLDLMLNLLSIAQLNKGDYQDLAQYYMMHKDCERILRQILTNISVQNCRKCILTVQKWWLLLSKQVTNYLNLKQMKKGDLKQDNFYVQEGENVSIKNALGVIILQLSQKWIYYLRSTKREVIIDIIHQLIVLNHSLVFFRSFFGKIIAQFTSIVKMCLGYEENPLEITCRKSKKQQNIQKSKKMQDKIEFYDRLRFKIYEIVILLPQQNIKILQEELSHFRSIVELQHEETKKDYLFNNNSSLANEYQLGKKLLQKIEFQ